MTKRLNISFDSDLLEAISSDFDLRAPNKEALRKLVFTLDGDYDPQVQQVLNLGLKDKKSWWRVSPSCFGGGLCGGGRARRWRRPIWG